MKILVILESPNKIKKVAKYLNEIENKNEYIVKASVGHFREIDDCGEYNIGIDFEKIEAKFVISKDKTKVVRDLIGFAKMSELIILATDPDREGEVIAWHLYEVLKSYCKNFKRMRLNSITKKEVEKELNNLGDLDNNYVNAGLARTYLDKTTGYILSKILQDNEIGKSAGRVQSAVLLILYLREIQIKNFIKEEWYVLEDENEIILKNVKVENEGSGFVDKKYKEFGEVMNVRQGLTNFYKVIDVKSERFEDKPFYNFTTSEFLKAAKLKLKLKTKVATKAAQILFESGLITYIRTDSTNVSEETKEMVIKYIKENIGEEYLGSLHTKKAKGSDQEGHPAITPTDMSVTANDIDTYREDEGANFLNEVEKAVYKLIWNNTLNSFLKVPFGVKNTYILKNNEEIFKGTSKEYEEYGYYNFDVTLKRPESKNLNYQVNDFVKVKSLQAKLKHNQAASNFNEATLIAELERLGIGRPSTYNNAVNINIERNYVSVDKNDFMIINENGKKVVEFLKEHFFQFINKDFTKEMEVVLDNIAKGKNSFENYIKIYYELLIKEGKKFMIDQIKCPKCNKSFVRDAIRKDGTKLGFKQCNDWQNCGWKEEKKIDLSNAVPCGDQECEGQIYQYQFSDKVTKEIKNAYKCTNKECKWRPGVIQKCNICNVGWLKEKDGKKGRFVSCNNYPSCNFIQSLADF